MPSSLSLGESWQLETHSLRAQMSGIRLWHSWLGAGIVEKPVAGCLRGNPGSRCFPTGAIVSFPCIALLHIPHRVFITCGHCRPPPTIRERIALSPRSLSNTKMGNCTALKHIFMQEFYCSRFRMPKTADFDKVVIRGKHEYV